MFIADHITNKSNGDHMTDDWLFSVHVSIIMLSKPEEMEETVINSRKTLGKFAVRINISLSNKVKL